MSRRYLGRAGNLNLQLTEKQPVMVPENYSSV